MSCRFQVLLDLALMVLLLLAFICDSCLNLLLVIVSKCLQDQLTLLGEVVFTVLQSSIILAPRDIFNGKE